MKRSQINAILAESERFIRAHGYVLPPFAALSPAEMRARRAELSGMIDARLGWDITDYGKGDFARTGLFLFTARNGRAADLAGGRGMLYAEKIMISRRDQLASRSSVAVIPSSGRIAARNPSASSEAT